MKDLKDTFIALELVLIGFQILIWVFLLVLAVFGYNWLHLSDIKEWSTEISVGLIGVAYMFGLIFDKAVGALPYSWVIGGSGLTKIGDLPSPLIMRMEILIKKPEVYAVLEKRIDQHRLVRSTVFNLALISLSALLFFIAQKGFTVRLFIVFLFLSIIFLGLTLFTGRRSAETLYFEMLHVYKAIAATKPADLGEGDLSLQERQA